VLAVGVCGYDDDVGIERLLNSCWTHVDLVFIIHGPFDKWSGDAPEHKGCDSTFPNVICHHTWRLPEYEQRQFYLDFCEEYGIDWLIIADTDEYFHPESDWGEFVKERERACDSDYLYNIKNYTEIGGLLLGLDQPRLIKNPSKVQYIQGHHYMLAEKGTDEAIIAKDTLYSIKLCHDPSIRTPERKDKHDQYIKWLRRYETEKMLYETPKEKENRERCVYAGA
jgi:glycosyltransferase involved in cell wall biosynthesis